MSPGPKNVYLRQRQKKARAVAYIKGVQMCDTPLPPVAGAAKGFFKNMFFIKNTKDVHFYYFVRYKGGCKILGPQD